MQLIDEGFRLPPPPGCPRNIYVIVMACWYGITLYQRWMHDGGTHASNNKYTRQQRRACSALSAVGMVAGDRGGVQTSSTSSSKSHMISRKGGLGVARTKIGVKGRLAGSTSNWVLPLMRWMKLTRVVATCARIAPPRPIMAGRGRKVKGRTGNLSVSQIGSSPRHVITCFLNHACSAGSPSIDIQYLHSVDNFHLFHVMKCFQQTKQLRLAYHPTRPRVQPPFYPASKLSELEIKIIFLMMRCWD